MHEKRASGGKSQLYVRLAPGTRAAAPAKPRVVRGRRGPERASEVGSDVRRAGICQNGAFWLRTGAWRSPGGPAG